MSLSVNDGQNVVVVVVVAVAAVVVVVVGRYMGLNVL
jgi:hypothetical protein